MKKAIITFAVMLTASYAALSQVNPGFEKAPATSNGWTLESGSTTWTIETTSFIRSGTRVLRGLITTSNARFARHTTNYNITVPASGTNYVHVIGYMLAGTTGDNARVQATSADGGTAITGTNTAFSSTNTWQRFTTSGTATNGKTYYPGFQVTGNFTSGGDIYRFDDIIIYTSTQASVDLTAPNSATGLSVSASGTDAVLTWTDGTDNATNTSGIEGVLILRISGDKTATLPTTLPQVYYATNADIGPTTIVNGADVWTVVHNGNASNTFTDAGAAGQDYTYVVLMRDKAFNYSSATAFYYVPVACTLPTSGGSIGNAQVACGPFNPSAFTNVAAASGFLGTLEYKWQDSIAGGTWTDISLSNAATFDAPSISQTTWYRRLARVTCSASWVGAAISNTVAATITTIPTSISASANPNPICIGDTLLLSATSTGATSWYWEGPNGFTSTLQNPIIPNMVPDAAGVYFLTASNVCGNGGFSDTFDDGDFTTGVNWTVTAGGFTASNNDLRGDNTATTDIISTPSGQAYGSWAFNYRLHTTATTCPTNNQVVRYFIVSNNASLSSNGYYVYIDVCNTAIQLRKFTGGSPSTLISGTWTPDISSHTIKVTRSSNHQFSLYFDGALVGQAVDSAYTTNSHVGCWNTGAFTSDNHLIDNIANINSVTPAPVVVQQPSLTHINATLDSNMHTGDYLWNGRVGNAWDTLSNWYMLDASGFAKATLLPNANNVFIVTPTTAINCVVTDSATVQGAGKTINSLVVESGAALTTLGSTTLSIHGHWIMEGLFTAETSTITFNGNGTQHIKSSWIGGNNNRFYNLIIDADTVSIMDSLSVSNMATVNDGLLDVDEDKLAIMKALTINVSGHVRLGKKILGGKGGEIRIE